VSLRSYRTGAWRSGWTVGLPATDLFDMVDDCLSHRTQQIPDFLPNPLVVLPVNEGGIGLIRAESYLRLRDQFLHQCHHLSGSQGVAPGIVNAMGQRRLDGKLVDLLGQIGDVDLTVIKESHWFDQ